METASTTQTRPTPKRRRMSPIAKITLVAAFLAVGATACGPHSGGNGGSALSSIACITNC